MKRIFELTVLASSADGSVDFEIYEPETGVFTRISSNLTGFNTDMAYRNDEAYQIGVKLMEVAEEWLDLVGDEEDDDE